MAKNENYKDNLKNHREAKVEKNFKLIKKSVDHMLDMNAEISIPNVAKTSYLLADTTKGEKGISAGGIRKNEIFKSYVLQEQSKQKQRGNGSKNTYKPMGSSGDLKIQIFELISENTKLKRDNKVYEDIVKNYCGDLDKETIISDMENKDYKQLSQISKNLFKRLLETELAQIDNDSGQLVLAPYGEHVLIDKKGVDLILKGMNI